MKGMLGRKGVIVLSLLLSIVLILGGCSSKKENMSTEPSTDSGHYENSTGGFTEDNESSEKSEAGGQDEAKAQNLQDVELGLKIIKTAHIEMETLNFDATTKGIIEKTSKIGGYIENSDVTGKNIGQKGNVQNRRASYRLRVPEYQLDSFILEFGNLGNVINSKTAGKDITGEYFDTEAHLKSLEIQEERLLEIFKKATEIKDIIELERELTDVRYRIENLTGTLKKWDNLVSYSTVDVYVYEVYEIQEVKTTPVSLGAKIVNGFNSSIKALIYMGKELIVLLATLVPFLIIIFAIGLVVIYFIRRVKKGRTAPDNKDNNEI